MMVSQLFKRVVRRVRLLALRLVVRPRTRTPHVRLGSAYGGWWVPQEAVVPGALAYCAGAGEDITFDLALHEAGCSVVTFDPTPRAIAYVERHGPVSERFRFVPVGWWHESDTLRFYAPRDETHVSHSVVNLQRTDSYFEAQVTTVRQLMDELGHDSVDIIKMDIEGAEHAVISSLLDDGPLPQVLCVEFDQPQPLRSVIEAVRRLRARGYRPSKTDGWNLTFVRASSA